MITFDSHVHTEFSPDSEAPMAVMARSAYDKGIKKIALTDHADWDFDTKALARPFDIFGRRAAYEKVRGDFEGRLEIIWGVEMGIADDPPILESQRRFLEELKPDFIIGSLHDYRGEDYYYEPFYKKRDKRRAYEDYFKAMRNCAKAAPPFDTLGHIDYIERYARYSDPYFKYEDHEEIIGELLEALLEKGAAVEVNTAGLRYGTLRADEPMLDIAAAYAKMGGRVTVGSDAHSPEYIGAGFGDAEGWLADRGIRRFQ